MIQITEPNLKAAREILEFVTQTEGCRRPHSPCITYDTAEGLLRLTSNCIPLGANELPLIAPLSCDSLGDGWKLGLETELILWLNAIAAE